MSEMTKRTRQILDYLQAIGTTTNRKALIDLGINGGSFTKRVSELVAMGYPITKTWKRHPATKDRYVEYGYDLDHGVAATIARHVMPEIRKGFVGMTSLGLVMVH